MEKRMEQNMESKNGKKVWNGTWKGKMERKNGMELGKGEWNKTGKGRIEWNNKTELGKWEWKERMEWNREREAESESGKEEARMDRKNISKERNEGNNNRKRWRACGEGKAEKEIPDNKAIK
jgi:hypothetical protein